MSDRPLSDRPVQEPRFVVISGGLEERGFGIAAGHSTIGREPGSEITLDDTNVSRRHATLSRVGSRVVLTDLGSTNGTWVKVNGCVTHESYITEI